MKSVPPKWAWYEVFIEYGAVWSILCFYIFKTDLRKKSREIESIKPGPGVKCLLKKV